MRTDRAVGQSPHLRKQTHILQQQGAYPVYTKQQTPVFVIEQLAS